jgi:cob(I)alamin adenosyltransferase
MASPENTGTHAPGAALANKASPADQPNLGFGAGHAAHQPDEHEQGHAMGWADVLRIAAVAVAAVAVWFHAWEPVQGVSVIGVLGLLIGGWPIVKEATENALARRMTMELSMAIAITAAAAISEFFTALVITLFVLVAEVLEGMTVAGVLQCGVCGATLVLVTGNPRRGERRYGCGFHREKGSHICANHLTVKIDTVEQRLLQAIRSRIMNPDAVHYLVGVVKQQLDAFRSIEEETRRDLDKQLKQVNDELQNIERAILAGVLSETTAALLQDREAQRRSLSERVAALNARSAAGALRVDGNSVARYLTKLEDLLNGDLHRSNAFFRSHLAPITCTPLKEHGRQFYRATVAVNGSEMIKSLGLAQAFDFVGCGGWI